MSKSSKVIACPTCEGKGIIYSTEQIGYHNADYLFKSEDCDRCEHRGVLMMTTTVKTRALKNKEFEPRRHHNGKQTFKKKIRQG